MKNYWLILVIFFFSCNKKNDLNFQTTEKLIDYSINNRISELSVFNFEFSLPGVSSSDAHIIAEGSVGGFLNYEKDGVEHIVMSPNGMSQEFYPVHYIKKDNKWVLENFYTNIPTGSVRNHEKISDGTYAYADHGIEFGPKWPYGHLWKFETIGEKLKWTQVSKVRSFYHSVSTGDFDSDGTIDFVGAQMGTFNNWHNSLHTYTQNSNGDFSENRDILTSVNFEGPYGVGAVLCVDLFGDKKPEIIRADYGFNQDNPYSLKKYSIVIFSYDEMTKKYEPVRQPGVIGVFSNTNAGATSMKAIDYDKDNDLDLVIAYEGWDNGIEIWENIGNGNFKPSNQRFHFTEQQLQFREFETVDVNNDGYIDILLHPFHYGLEFRTGLTNYTFGNFGDGIKLNKCILINNKGKFEFYDKEITIPNIRPGFMKGSFIKNKIKFTGLGRDKGGLFLYEVNIKI